MLCLPCHTGEADLLRVLLGVSMQPAVFLGSVAYWIVAARLVDRALNPLRARPDRARFDR